MYVTDPCVSCGMRKRIPTLNLNLILNPKLDLIPKLNTVALLPTRPRDPIYTLSHSRISTLSHTHTQAHPEVSKQMTDILRHYDKGSETASEPNDWRKLCQELTGRLVEIEKDIGRLDMRVTHATITLTSGVVMRQLFAPFTSNQIDRMPALRVNIQTALEIHLQ
jgi:hypothetical protein